MRSRRRSRSPLAGCINGSPVDTTGTVEFETPLPIPALVEGTDFSLEAQEGTTEFAGIPTKTLGYNGSYLGPTLVMNRGDDVRVHLQNSLEETTTLHWHGMHLPADMDGGPHQPVEPGQPWDPEWTVDQPAATLWYHPHPHGETERQVGMGLAGMVILRDDAEAALPLPRDYGVDDLPVIVQDATLPDGAATSLCTVTTPASSAGSATSSSSTARSARTPRSPQMSCGSVCSTPHPPASTNSPFRTRAPSR